jgi:3-oxoacyl-[acyl-carrier protein] reductase
MAGPLVDLTGSNIVITGPGKGIGQAVARQVVALGGNVTGIDLDEAGLAALQAELGEARCLTLVGSVTDQEFVRGAVARSVERFGAVHGLVNNAGIIRPAMMDKMTVDDWRAVLEVHMTGAFLCSQAVGQHMIARRKAGDTAPAAIVSVSSTAGQRGTIGQVNYAAAKAGILGITMSAAREWARYNIRANSVSFGSVTTDMTRKIQNDPKLSPMLLATIALGRFSTPEEVAKPVCFLLSEAASYITGQHLNVDGGLHIRS